MKVKSENESDSDSEPSLASKLRPQRPQHFIGDDSISRYENREGVDGSSNSYRGEEASESEKPVTSRRGRQRPQNFDDEDTNPDSEDYHGTELEPHSAHLLDPASLTATHEPSVIALPLEHVPNFKKFCDNYIAGMTMCRGGATAQNGGTCNYCETMDRICIWTKLLYKIVCNTCDIGRYNSSASPNGNPCSECVRLKKNWAWEQCKKCPGVH